MRRKLQRHEVDFKSEYRNKSGEDWDQEMRIIITTKQGERVHTTRWYFRRLAYVKAEEWLRGSRDTRAAAASDNG